MDTQELTREIMKRHQVGLKPDDPIFVTLTLNELLLANHQEQFKAILEQQAKQHDLLAQEAIKTHIQSSTDLSNRLLKAMHDDFEQTKQDLKAVFQSQIEAIRQEKASCISLFNSAVGTMNLYAYAIALLGGIMLGFLFRGLFPH